MDLTIIISVGVCLAVFGLSGFLFFLLSRKQGSPYRSIEDQLKDIEQVGNKSKPKSRPHKPNKGQKRPEESPKPSKEETAKPSEGAGPRKESPLEKKKSQPSPKPPQVESVGEAKVPTAAKVEPTGAGKGEKRQQRSAAKPVDDSQRQQAASKVAEPPKPQVTEVIRQEPAPETKSEPKPARSEPKKPVASAQAQKPDSNDGEKHPKQKSKAKGPAKASTSFMDLREQVDQIVLSEDEMHSLIEILLAKRQENEAWREAGSKASTAQQLRKQLDDMTEKYEEARTSAELFAVNVKKLRGELTASNTRHQQMESSAQSQIERLRKEKDSLQKRLLKAEEEEKERAEQQQQQQQQPPPELEQALVVDVPLVSAENPGSNSLLDGLQDEISRLNEKLSKSEAEQAQVERDNKSMQALVQEEQARVVELTKANNTNVQSLRGSSSLVEEENRKIKDQLSKKDIEIADYARKLKSNVQQMQESVEQLKDEQERLTSDLTEKNFTIQTLQTQLQTAKQSAAASSEGRVERVKELEGRVAQLEKDNGDLKTETSSSQGVIRDLDETSKKKTESLEAEVAGLLKEIEGQKEVVANLTNSKEELQASLDSLGQNREVQQTQEAVQAPFDLASLGLTPEAIATKEKALQNMREKLTGLQKELDPLKAVVADLTVSKEELQAAVEILKQEQGQAAVKPPVDAFDGGLLSWDTAEDVAATGKELESLKEKLTAAEKERKEVEAKVQDLKRKNKELYEKSWKAKDEVSDVQRKAKEEASTIWKNAEEKMKVAVEKTKKAEQESTKSKLSQLAPDVEVEEADSLESWLEKFVHGVISVATPASNGLQCPTSPSPSQDDKVEELEASLRAKEQSELQLEESVTNLTDTLQRTRSSLAGLQSNVEGKIEDLKADLAQTKDLLEKERSSKQSLQSALDREVTKAKELAEDLQKMRNTTYANQVEEAGENGRQMTGQNKEQVQEEEIDAVIKDVLKSASPLPGDETQV